MRHEIGVRTILWGSDFPHPEGTYPFTRESLRNTFCNVPTDEVRAMIGGNLARIYGFDLDRLQPVADRVGPSPEEVAEPLNHPPAHFRRFATALGGE
jgi:hypothetical protein